MSNTLLIAVLAGLAGMLGWGAADFFAKKTIDKIGDMATLTWAHFFGVTMLIILVVGKLLIHGNDVVFPKSFSEIGILAFFGALQATVYFFVYRAFAVGKLAILNPIFSSYSGLVVLLSVLAFGEVIGIEQFVLLIVVFIGIISISLDEESFAIRKLKIAKLPGMKDILTATSLAALWTVLWGHFVNGKDWLIYAAIMYLFMSITIVVMSLVQKINLRITDNKIWKYFFLIGLGEVVAYVGVSIGYSLTSHTSIVAVLSAAFSVPTLILAHIFLGERITSLQKAGVALVIVGVSLLPLL